MFEEQQGGWCYWSGVSGRHEARGEVGIRQLENE